MITPTIPSRQPIREAWTHERFERELAVALNASIDISSAHTYGSALNSWIEFCRINQFPTEPTEKTLAFFVVYRFDTHQPQLCRLIFVRSVLVSRALKGCKRIHGQAVKRKDPLTLGHLRTAIDRLPAIPTHDDLLFLAILLSGFHALHRLGEMTMPDNPKLRNPRKYTKRESVTLNAESYEYWLPAHKADVAFEGNRIIIADQAALKYFLLYLDSRDRLLPFNPYLWARENGQVPPRAWFIKRLKHFFPNPNIAGQSLRAGGATHLAEDGALPHIIQAAGRWSSEAFQVYLRKHPTVLHGLLRARRQRYPTLIIIINLFSLPSITHIGSSIPLAVCQFHHVVSGQRPRG
ncbi:RNase H domain-containing protein [Mycena indigotica]|uniref:RNase H domain-containing protein n=1 Tax=Mycena indigotica TaxID=2126181 RepID=A0A8H6W2C2_9AGAR|nr:RNase H domain-containing protein [Mycena indigotica]KAF7299103.1 RNase H domain-containing protein [Mycena indigotica]